MPIYYLCILANNESTEWIYAQKSHLTQTMIGFIRLICVHFLRGYFSHRKLWISTYGYPKMHIRIWKHIFGRTHFTLVPSANESYLSFYHKLVWRCTFVFILYALHRLLTETLSFWHNFVKKYISLSKYIYTIPYPPYRL